MNKPPRLLPHLRLPPYSYVPRKFPHPISDADGHSYQAEPEAIDSFDALSWKDCDEYLRGIDLFNHGYYWEAHESWEAVWNAAGRTGPTADFLKGLIKLAAALVKAREGNERGVARHATRADELFRAVRESGETDEGQFLGLQFTAILTAARTLFEHPARFVDTRDEPVVRIGDLELQINNRKQHDA